MPATNKATRNHGQSGDDGDTNSFGSDAGGDRAFNNGLWNADNGLRRRAAAAISPPAAAGDPPAAPLLLLTFQHSPTIW